jgi:lipid A 3-O-deacylase
MKKILKYSFCSLYILLISLNGICQSQNFKHELGFNSENDSFLASGQDRYYTNGLFINYRSAFSVKKETDTLKYRKKIWSISVGQQIFNAQSGAVPNISYIDRPFASYLYAGFGLQFFHKHENNTQFSLQIGTIGPSAQGEKIQKIIHSTFGFYDLNGWQYQVNNELGINFKFQSHFFIFRSKNKKTDFSLPIEARIGNTYSGLKTGLLFRTGNLNPFYHSLATNSNISSYKESSVNKKELYFYLKPSVDLIWYDATIKGGLFVKDKGLITYQSKPVVLSHQIGFAYANERWTADFSAIFKSKELKEMTQTNQYGSLSIYYRF